MSTGEARVALFRDAVDRLKEVEGVKDDKDIAEKLGLSRSNFSKMGKDGGTKGGYVALLQYALKKRISLDWLFTGKTQITGAEEGDQVDVVIRLSGVVFELFSGASPSDGERFENMMRVLVHQVREGLVVDVSVAKRLVEVVNGGVEPMGMGHAHGGGGGNGQEGVAIHYAERVEPNEGNDGDG